MSGFQLGQRVAYTEHLKRRHAQPGEFLGPQKIWSNSLGPLHNEGHRWPGGEGVIVGKRTLSNGNVVYPYDEGGGEYIPKERFTAWLIAYDLQRKPVHVLPEHVTTLEEIDQHFHDTGCDSSLHPDDCLGAVESDQGALL